MERTQISLTAEQADRLRRIASKRHTSMAALIRDAVDQVVREEDGPTNDELWERVFKAAGAFHDRDGATDVAENHDKYLEEIYADRAIGNREAPRA